MTDEERQELVRELRLGYVSSCSKAANEIERLEREATEFQRQAMEWQQRAYKAERELERGKTT